MDIEPYGQFIFGVSSTTKTIPPVGKGSFEYADPLYYNDPSVDTDVIRLANAIIRYQNEQLLQVSGSGAGRRLYPYIQ